MGNGASAPPTGLSQAEPEVWLHVPGYEGLYIISNLGRVRASRVGAPILSTKGTDKDGYPIVAMNRGGTRHTYALHRLVCRAFHGEPTALHREAAHLDGDRSNARADNLKWVSKVENHSHKRRHGTHQEGDNAGNRTLTSGQVTSIRHAKGIYSGAVLAEIHGVSRQTIYGIWQGKRWRSLPEGQEPVRRPTSRTITQDTGEA